MKGTTAATDDEPIPKLCTVQRLWTVFFIQLNEAYQINVLLPMVVFMLRDFGISATQVGLYQGIFNASFCFCQFLTCYLWGALSDRYGRRLILIIGLVFSSIAIVLLGFATTFPIAVAIRCTGGFFNGNLGVMKAYLADITDSTNRAWAFSILAISWGVGSVIASTCGGLLLITHDANQRDYIPTTGVLKWWIFEEEYPYLLPFALGGVISTFALMLTIIYIHNEKIIYHDNIGNEDKGSELEMGSYLSVPLNNKRGSEVGDTMFAYSLDALTLNLAEIGPGCHNTLPTPSTFAAMRADFDKTEKQKLPLIKNGDNGTMTKYQEEIVSMDDLIKKTKMLSALSIFSLCVIAAMIFNNLAPVFLAQSLDFNSQFVGYNIACAGLFLLLFTWYLQPYLLRRFRYKILVFIGSGIMVIATLSMPACAFLYDYMDEWGLLMVTNLVQIVNVSGGSILFVCVMCYVNNSVPNRFVGKANGVSQSLAALSRAIGPPLAGAVWSWSYSQESQFAVFYSYMLAVIAYLMCMVVAYFRLTDADQLPLSLCRFLFFVYMKIIRVLYINFERWEEREKKGLPTIMSMKKSLKEEDSFN